MTCPLPPLSQPHYPLFSLSCSRHHPDLHSFPTRRSSDLPVTLAAFFDAGINKIMRPSQLILNQGRLDDLNGLFPQASFGRQVVIADASQNMRSSTGLELQIMMPVVNAPFRLYWAYNPQILQDPIIPPIVTDRSMFPNNATFFNSIALYGQVIPPFEKRKTFRFTISRTF